MAMPTRESTFLWFKEITTHTHSCPCGFPVFQRSIFVIPRIHLTTYINTASFFGKTSPEGHYCSNCSLLDFKSLSTVSLLVITLTRMLPEMDKKSSSFVESCDTFQELNFSCATRRICILCHDFSNIAIFCLVLLLSRPFSSHTSSISIVLFRSA